MLNKKIIALVSVFVLAGLILPAATEAIAGIYGACQGKIKPDGTCSGTTKDVCYEGFVPCGKKVAVGGSITDDKCKCPNPLSPCEQTVQCQFCHFFVMLNGIIYFILIDIVPYLAVLMLVIAGIMFYFSHFSPLEKESGNPKLMGRAKALIKGVVIGLFLIYGAYMLVGLFLTVIGVSKTSGLSEWMEGSTFFKINCSVEIP